MMNYKPQDRGWWCNSPSPSIRNRKTAVRRAQHKKALLAARVGVPPHAGKGAQ